MADRPQELVFCHVCQNEWHRNEHGLTCPACHSDFVEVIEEGHDPRDSHADDVEEIANANPEPLSHRSLGPTNPFHGHHPWGAMAPDPEEGDIAHVEWNPTPGVHFSRTSFRATLPGTVRTAQNGPGGINDPIAQLFQGFSSMMGDPNGSRRNNAPPQLFRPEFPQHAHDRDGRDLSPIRPRDASNPQPNILPIENLQGLLGSLLRGMQDTHGGTHVTPVAPLNLIHQLLNPGNSRHGDAVYSDEALDRIITQFMEAQTGHTAPGPASAAAIAALPNKKVEDTMLGSDGQAECSVCMDNVSVGDEVTVLPCGHWFHGECVGAWLKEHDTCPHCRQGIMPKDGEPGQAENSPRLPGQVPRVSQPPLSPGDANGFQFAWHQHSSSQASSPNRQETPSAWSRHEGQSRRRSGGRNGGEGSSAGSGNANGSGGISGWIRNHLGSSSNHDSS